MKDVPKQDVIPEGLLATRTLPQSFYVIQHETIEGRTRVCSFG